MPFAVNNGTRIHYEVTGAGAPLVLLDGATVGLETWHELGYVNALRDDYRLILIDARAHGESDKPHDPAQYAPELMAGDVIAVLDDLGVAQAHYLGASMGAAIGFELARRAPECLLSLILMGYGRYGALTAVEQQFHAMGKQMFAMGVALGGAGLVAALDQPARPLSPVMKKQYLANDWVAQQVFNDAFAAWPAFDEDLPRMAVPSLVIVTENDAFRESAGRCAAAMPQAEFILLPGGRHSQADYGPERVLLYARAFWSK